MKRLLAVVAVVVLMVCSVGTALGDTSSVGKTLMDGALTYLDGMNGLYKASKDTTGDFIDKYLDQIFGYAIMYLDGQIIYYAEMAEIVDGAFEGLIASYSFMIETLCEARQKYSSGDITKEDFKKQLFITVDVIVAAK